MAFEAAETLAGSLPPERMAGLRKLRSRGGDLLDEGLVICFPEGGSFTGEQSVELQVHGSLAVVSALLDQLAMIPGLRLAEAGEFSRRALQNDRLDLAQIEGLGDLIEAETEAQRLQALRVFSGAIGRKVEAWRADLIRASALIEAMIDFADEDIPQNVWPEVEVLLGRTSEAFQAEIDGFKVSERIRDGFEVAIVGAPNVGKSTLLNALAGRDAAITSEIAGTTRDVIEVRMDLGGLPVTLLDTAGLRETQDIIESIGIRRAIERAELAELRIFLGDGSEQNWPILAREGDIIALAKADLIEERSGWLAVSGVTGQGVDELLRRVEKSLMKHVEGAATITRARHRRALLAAFEHLCDARARIAGGDAPPELIAADLRNVVRDLESLVGRIGVEDYLSEIFSSFCIGK